MCICVNCHWIDRCKTYHAVERQHGVEHLTQSPDFQGNNPAIHIIVKDIPNQSSSIEWDVRSCESFREDEGKWLRLCPGKEIPT
ncbi:Ycf34 family protein [Prochlorococcus marinus]|uniref:Putative Ycf34 n=1 Tax=Prochlorococcus marinus (strain MIT 9211) TaxID=93059 RepID=A9BCZ8_PROM4|nr:Ycf34 family protein [Prochlorococcus marinus]ABX08086.1 putative Ycf34 [Prochlorococcus marinus str. MIT 9211]